MTLLEVLSEFVHELLRIRLIEEAIFAKIRVCLKSQADGAGHRSSLWFEDTILFF
jgi:hypothetical protein